MCRVWVLMRFVGSGLWLVSVVVKVIISLLRVCLRILRKSVFLVLNMCIM